VTDGVLAIQQTAPKYAIGPLFMDKTASQTELWVLIEFL
jgi:hypothetical protein